MLRPLVEGFARLHLGSHSPALYHAASRMNPPGNNLEKINPPGPLYQSVRTTFILKRRFPVPLKKAHKKRTIKMKGRHFVYDLVEDTNVKKKDPLKLILLTGVEGVGSKGDVVEVSPHRARRDLLLPGIAVYASPENLEKYSKLLEEAQSEDQPSSQFVRRTAEQISIRVISVCMNMKNPWQIEPWHVRVAFRKAGIIVPEEALTLPAQPIVGPDPSLQGKEFLVKIKINNKEEIPVRCRIHHYSSEPRERLPWVANHWEYPADPIFPEEAGILAELTANNTYTRYPQEEIE